MARVAFVMDKVLRRFGLSGRSFVPMLVGSAAPCRLSCRPVMFHLGARPQDDCIMLTPFMSCSAKLPVYGLLCGAFFPQAPLPWSRSI